MLIKTMRFIGVGIAGLALANTASAESNVMSGAASANIGGTFRAALTHSDNGLGKTKDVTPDASDVIGVQEADLVLHGKIDSKTKYLFEFSLLAADYNSKNAAAIAGGATAWDTLEQAYASHTMGPVTWTLGRQFVHQGGWDWAAPTHSAHAAGKYSGAHAFNLNEDALTIGFEAGKGNKIALQLLNDHTVDSGKAQWNKRSQPTFALAYHGNFGGIEPLFHYGTWDNQKSSWMDIGAKTEMNGLMASLDFSTTTWADKVADGDDTKAENNVSQAITLNLAYSIKGTATPYLYISTYDMKQHTDDVKVNSAGGFEDNGFTWSIGADIDAIGGANYKPFFTITSHSGKYPGDDDPTKEESKSEMNIELGAWGNI